MRIAAISDIHGNIEALEAVLADIRARYVLIEKTDAGWKPEFIALEYDWEAAAQLADQRGRPDWAVALRTGFA